jgi:subtilisin-like proprotein convertase family protein
MASLSMVQSRLNPFRPRPGRIGSARAKKQHLRRLALEGLEARTLLSVLPPPVHDPKAPVTNVAEQLYGRSPTANDSNPTVVVNPINPSEVVTVWVVNDSGPSNPYSGLGNTAYLQGAISNDGGQTWGTFNPLPNGILIDPASGTNPKYFTNVDNPTLGFDRDGNLYEEMLQHSGTGSGALVLEKFSFSGSVQQTVLYEWQTGSTTLSVDPVLDATMAVDSNVGGATFYVDPNTGAIQNDPASGDVYIAYTLDTPPPSTNPPNPWNPYTVELRTSSDGGNTFSPPLLLGAPNAFEVEQDVAPRIAISQGTASGVPDSVPAGQVTVVYDDINSARALSPPRDVIRATRVAAGGGSVLGRSVVAITTVLGSTTNNFPLAAAAAPNGIGPDASIASDNTLGSFSTYEGRLYVTYVDRYYLPSQGGNGNPPDNTDIFLTYSDDGGQTWSGPEQINDDSAVTDGYSEGVQQGSLVSNNPDGTASHLEGRPQFQPSVAVDPVTGAVVVTFYDARYDAARARVATTVTVSIDGGQTFSPQNMVFANQANTAFDEITRQTVTLGPIPDNDSSGNPVQEKTYGFGSSQGLAVYDGRIYPAWSGNDNGGDRNGSQTGNDSIERLGIHVAPMTFAAGPRVIASTEGQVQAVTVDGVTFNNTTAGDGTPRLDGFVVQFDEPVAISSFTTSQVQAYYHSPTTPSGNPGTALAIGTIQPLDPSGPLNLEATTFLVHYAQPQSATGTYTYAIGPDITDMHRTPTSNGNAMDQNGNAIPGEDPGDIYAVPTPLNGVPFEPPYANDSLPLIIPGPHVVATDAVYGTPSATAQVSATADNLVTDTTVSAVDVVFDRDMNPATFTPSQVLQIMGPAGPVALPAGSVTIIPNPKGSDPDPNHPRTYRIEFPTQELSGTYTVTLGTGIASANGDLVDANQNAGVDVLLDKVNPTGTTVPITYNSADTPVTIAPGQSVSSTINVPDIYTLQGITLELNITYPYDPDLTVTLTAPAQGSNPPVTITLFSGVGTAGNNQNFFNTIFDDNADTLIQNGGPPFFGRFKPQEPLSTFVSDGTDVHGAWTLTITNNSTNPAHMGTLANWSLTLLQQVTGTGLGEPVADRTQFSFRIFTMDPANPLSSNTWTAVGPADINSSGGGPESVAGGNSGRIGGLAVDPSDPTGNTVYVAGASGGVWKTNDFLTTAPQGPTYIPLTDFGPTFGINIGGLAVFGRNNDPNQSIVVAATGEGDTGSKGVGFLISLDGGQTWSLMDSTDNTKPFAQRDHAFVGDYAYKVVVDPKPTSSGGVIIYAALSGPNPGIWRSLDTGLHWQLMLPGQATDVVLDPNSGFVNATNPTGNLQILYAAIRSQGVYISQNQGEGWDEILGGIGDPLFQNIAATPLPTPIPVNAPPSTPTGGGRIVLAKPFLTGNPEQDLLYEGWLYAAVVANNGNTLQGLYLTKDFGQNWTDVLIPNVYDTLKPSVIQAVPSNNNTLPNYNPLGGPLFPQGNYDISLAIDPVNPNVVYLGGSADGQPSGLIRIDTTGIADPYAFYLGEDAPDGGLIRASTTSPYQLSLPDQVPNPFYLDPRTDPTINMIHNPFAPFSNATFYTANGADFSNTGAYARWIPFDDAVNGSTDQHRVFSFIDPATGLARIVFGDDQGVFTALDAGNGTLVQSIGDPSVGGVPVASGSRNGNLQITQFYYGASQPSLMAALQADINYGGGMFYGSAQDNGFPVANPNIINPSAGIAGGYGQLVWSGPGGDGGGVGTDQTGSGDVYQYKWPCCGGNITDFLQWDGVGRTFGLIQSSTGSPVPDPQWPFEGVVNFAVNPINGQQVVISSTAGNVFRTENQGKFWLEIAAASVLDGTQSLALAYGAPDPTAPGGIGSLDNFIYVGTNGGHIFMTRTGGGTNGAQWVNISSGLDGSAVQDIVTDPTRGSHDAYAVTLKGVYYIADSTVAGATWTNITGNLFQVMHNIFGDPNFPQAEAAYLTSVAVDWRYVIPGPGGTTFPMIYVGGEAGVYRSLDNGQTWSFFPDSGAGSLLNAPLPDGGLPVAHVTALNMALGNIDPTTGRPNVATGPNILLATTYGRGSFAIHLAPITFPNSLKLDPNLPPPNGSDSSHGLDITNVTDPVIDGLSEQTAFGNVVTIDLIDLTNPNNPVPIPTVAGTNQTNALGQFQVQIAPGYFKSDGSTDGVKVIGVQAVDASGTKGNIATFTFTLKTAPVPAPNTPVLDAVSDKGFSNSDGITNVNNSPLFDIGGVIPGDTVTLQRAAAGTTNFQTVGTIVVPNGVTTVQIADTLLGPIPDGVWIYEAYQTDIANNVSKPSAPTTPPMVTIGTVAPAQPAIPQLLPADDSGVKGDYVTNVKQPHLIGTLVPESTFPGSQYPVEQVEIINTQTNAVMGTAFSQANGSYTVQFAQPLADGVYTLELVVNDIFGNTSPPSATFHLQILTHPPTPPTIALLPADDSGVKGDNITNVRQPHLTGTADPGVTIELIDTNGDVTHVPGTVLATTVVGGNGVYIVQFPAPLADGTYHVQTEAVDIAGNASLSPILALTILATPPKTVPTLGLLPSDQYGFQPPGDGVTFVRRPFLVGVSGPNQVIDLDNTAGTVLAVTTTASNGSYALQLPQDLVDGAIVLQAQATDVAGNQGPKSAPFTLQVVTVPGDYTNNGAADLALFRPTTDQWFITGPAGGQASAFGGPGDLPLQGDFNGDGKDDLAVFRPATDQWFIALSSSVAQAFTFGGPGDVAVPASFEGYGRTDPAVYRPTTGQWFVAESTGGVAVAFGGPGDVPVPADYFGVGHAEFAVFRPSTDQWFIIGPNGGVAIAFGGPGDVPVPADYDGVGHAEFAVYRPATGQFFIIGPRGPRIVSLGVPGDSIPVPLDYTGSGHADPAVYVPSLGTWLISEPSGVVAIPFGAANLDIPVPAATLSQYPSAFSLPLLTPGFSASNVRAAAVGVAGPAASPSTTAIGVPTAVVSTVVGPSPTSPALASTAAVTVPVTTVATTPGNTPSLGWRRRPIVTQRPSHPLEGSQALRARPAQDAALEAALNHLGPFSRRGRFFAP